MRRDIGNFALSGLIDRGPIKLPDPDDCDVKNVAQHLPASEDAAREEYFILEKYYQLLTTISKGDLRCMKLYMQKPLIVAIQPPMMHAP